MAEIRKCSFCYREIEPGTGKMYVKKDGTVLKIGRASCRERVFLTV